MRSPRWSKVLGDLRAERGRMALMAGSMALGLSAVGAVLGAFAVLDREIAAQYLGTRPAHATLVVPAGADARAIEEDPEIAEAEARDRVQARVRVGDGWKRISLFVVDDFDAIRLNRFHRRSGAWPPPRGAMLVERLSLRFLEAREGGALTVRTPHGAPTSVAIAGVVHDPGLAPGWQEQASYGYVSRETIRDLGEPSVLREARILLRPAPANPSDAEAAAVRIADRLKAKGIEIAEIRVPSLGKHPHQGQMDSMQRVLLVLSAMLVALSAILTASLVASLLARQTREIGIMKVLGAGTGQVVRLYATLVALLGIAAWVVAAPLGWLGARGLARGLSFLINFDLTDESVPPWVFAAQGAAALLVPLALAAVPILRACRIPVREALSATGARSDFVRPWMTALPLPLRNAIRRPARLAVTMSLFVLAGAVSTGALNVKKSFDRTVDRFSETRPYDVDVLFGERVSEDRIRRLANVPGVRAVETWGYGFIAFERPSGTDLTHTYPDGGHGRVFLLAPPFDSTLVRFTVLEGRWLRPDDTDALVLSRKLAQSRGLKVGDRAAFSIDGVPSTWAVVGIVDEAGPFGAFVAGRGGSTNMARIAFDPGEQDRTLREIETVLADERYAVQWVLPSSEVRTILVNHLEVIVRAVILMALLVTLVGVLSLASAVGVNVAERTREIGMMKAVGATRLRILRTILGESAIVGAASAVVSAGVSMPLTALVLWILNRVGFMTSLPFALSPAGYVGWLAVVTAASVAAAVPPAWRAARLTVKDALAQT